MTIAAVPEPLPKSQSFTVVSSGRLSVSGIALMDDAGDIMAVTDTNRASRDLRRPG